MLHGAAAHYRYLKTSRGCLGRRHRRYPLRGRDRRPHRQCDMIRAGAAVSLRRQSGDRPLARRRFRSPEATGIPAARDAPGSLRCGHVLLKVSRVEVPTTGVEQLWNPRTSSAPTRRVEARPRPSAFTPAPLRLGPTTGIDPSSNFLGPCSCSVRCTALICKRSKSRQGARTGHIVH